MSRDSPIEYGKSVSANPSKLPFVSMSFSNLAFLVPETSIQSWQLINYIKLWVPHGQVCRWNMGKWLHGCWIGTWYRQISWVGQNFSKLSHIWLFNKNIWHFVPYFFSWTIDLCFIEMPDFWIRGLCDIQCDSNVHVMYQTSQVIPPS